MLKAWLSHFIDTQSFLPLAGDASFRQYNRITTTDKQTFIGVHAPLSSENSSAFIDIAERLRAQKLRTPIILQYDLSQGFLLLEDFGDQLLFTHADGDNLEIHYAQALKKLIVLQQTPSQGLTHFNATTLLQELHFFIEWFCEIHLQYVMNHRTQTQFNNIFNCLLDNANAQPQVFIHRDYHSRNLMLLKDDMGIIDFQDAMIGTITYDAVSLLRDCYKILPTDLVQSLLKLFYNELSLDVSFETFQQWFDRMGVQRHLKAIFIFARKFRRDNNPNYLPDITRALAYIEQVTQADPQLMPLHTLLIEDIYPRLQALSV